MKKILVGDFRFSGPIDDETVMLLDANVQFGECKAKVKFVCLVWTESGDELLNETHFF